MSPQRGLVLLLPCPSPTQEGGRVSPPAWPVSDISKVASLLGASASSPTISGDCTHLEMAKIFHLINLD